MKSAQDLVAGIASGLKGMAHTSIEKVAVELALNRVEFQISTLLAVDERATDLAVENAKSLEASEIVQIRNQYQQSVYSQSIIQEINTLREVKRQLLIIKQENGNSITQ